MATQQGQGATVSRQWTKEELQQFILKDITATGTTLGSGSYGSVLEVILKSFNVIL